MRLVLIYFLALCAAQSSAMNIEEEINFSAASGVKYVAFTITTPFEGEITYSYKSKEILREYLEIATNNSVLQALELEEQADFEAQVPLAELFAVAYWEKLLEILPQKTFTKKELDEILQDIAVKQIVAEIDPKKGWLDEDNRAIARKHAEKLGICHKIFTSSKE